MKETPLLSINISKKSFNLCLLAAQQILSSINNRETFRIVAELNPEAEKIKFKVYPKDIQQE